MYFDLEHPGIRCTIGDALAPLTAVYRCVRDCPQELLEYVAILEPFQDLRSFESVRAEQPSELPPMAAARFLYLIATGFNGLYRENSSGRYNVSYGDGKWRQVLNPEKVHSAWKQLQGTTIVNADFETTCSSAKTDDFIYFDPPYMPISSTASFSSYAAGDFKRADHERLAEFIGELSARGVRVMLSNSDCPATRDIYGDLNLYSVRARRSCGASRSSRQAVTELIATNYYFEEMVDGNEFLGRVQPLNRLF